MIEYLQQKEPETSQDSHNTNLDNVFTLGQLGLGKGKIGEGIEIDSQLSDVFSRIQNGEFNTEVPFTIASICIDERFNEAGTRPNLPRTAGGPVGAAHAYDMAVQDSTMDELQVVRKATNNLIAVESGVSAHGDDAGECGCGQAKLAPSIHQEIYDNNSNLRDAANALGFNIESQESELFSDNVQHRLDQSDYFVDGTDQRKAVLEAAVDEGAGFENLVGEHDASGILLVTDRNNNPNLDEIKEKTGHTFFAAHLWSFRKTAEALNTNGSEIETDLTVKSIALINLATASILCNEDMPVIVM